MIEEKALLEKLKDQGIKIALTADNKLEIKHQGTISQDTLLEIKTNKAKLIDYFSMRKYLREQSDIPLAAQSISYPLSPAQRRLWFLNQFDKNSLAYNIPFVLSIQGELAIDVLEESFNFLIDRHEILRTVYRFDDSGSIRQWVLPAEECKLQITFIDLENNAHEEIVNANIDTESKKVFDLENGPLLRGTVLRKSSDDFVFICVMHHIVCDGWSVNIIMRDLFLHYNSTLKNEVLQLPDLKLQYKDYAVWHQRFQTDRSKAFWGNQFRDDQPKLNFPLDCARPKAQTFNGAVISSTISEEKARQIEGLYKESGATSFMCVLALVNVLLYKYTGQTDIVLGSPMMFRPHYDLFDQVGLYLNTVVYRNQFSQDDDFVGILKKIKGNAIKSYAHKDYPFDQLIDDLNLERDMSRNPLFDIMVILNNNEMADFSKSMMDGISIKPYKTNTESIISKFDLSINFTEVGNKFLVDIEYNTDLFKQQTVEQLSHHLHTLIDVVIANPTIPLSDLTLLSKEEEKQLLLEFNDTNANYPSEKPLIQLFEEQVEQTPDNIAVVFENNQLTYNELNEKANRLGDYLRQTYNIKPDDLVAIKLDRSEWMIVAILGVLKSGAAYVPIDPEYPQDRIDYMLKDSKAKTLIDQEKLTKLNALQSKYSTTNLEIVSDSNHLAYVIYTSGSTGKPKAVEQLNSTINNIVHHADSIDNSDSIKFDRLLQFASFSFDVSIQEVMTTLLKGSSLYVASTDLKFDTTALFAYMVQNKIDGIYLPTSYFTKVFLDEFIATEGSSVLKHIIVAGEKLSISTQSIAELNRKGITLHDHYGPTETHVVTSKTYAPNRKFKPNTIGSPISNTQIYILDQKENLVPIGVVGEICVSGDGVARGYSDRPELTAKKFVPNPFTEGRKMYKTGDLGKWLPDGTIQFIGRKDHQLKIRGYRVELGEIEHALQQYTAIQECVVLPKESKGNETELVAYLKSQQKLNTKELRTHLQANLPAYMIPTYFVQLEEFPLTQNGKLNKKALPNPSESDLNGDTEYVAPRTDIEKQLVIIWSEVLGIEAHKIGINDDFFELGGHSLKATTVISKIAKELSVKLSIKDVFTNKTVEKIGASIEVISLANEAEDTADFDLVI